MRRNRGFLEISFAWLFAIIAGAVILVLAIFAATKIINIGQYSSAAQTQNQIAVLLNPLETSFEAGQVTSIGISAQTRIYNQCDDQSGTFGNQIIRTSQQSFGGWSTPTNGAAFQNKYIFSNNTMEGQQFYLFSKPFNFPFKVSDLIYMTSSLTYYCFVNPPSNIQDELSTLGEKNILLTDDMQKCPSKSLKICFPGENCDISVNLQGPQDIASQGTVSENGSTVTFYSDALMYGAIFSDNSTYECQLKRLMERESQLSSLYVAKVNTILQIGCKNSNLISDLTQLGSSSDSFRNSNSDINSQSSIITLINNIQSENSILGSGNSFKLW
jgi:hypothetical protein